MFTHQTHSWTPRVRFASGIGLALLALLGAMAAAPPSASAQIFNNRVTFLADPRVGATTVIDFDSIATGTDLAGQTISGATLTSAGTGQPLVVIAGATGVRNPMSPSTAPNVLSPGGSTPTVQDDDLQITLSTPVQAFGLDVVFDVPDGASFVSATFFDINNVQLAQQGTIPAPNGAPGFQFVGFISNSANIARVVFGEFDGTALDDNVAYDTITFSATGGAGAVPEPGTCLLMTTGVLGAAGAALRRRRNLSR